jgi:polysaccharide deacetylase 2 family uncharacterized protein YibQ
VTRKARHESRPGRVRGLLLTCLIGFTGAVDAQVNGQTVDRTMGQGAELPAISIIIDDLGYRRLDGLRAIELPGPVAYAVLPHTPYGSRLAGIAFQLDKEVLLHVPMASSVGKALGPGGLTRSMAQAEIRAVLDAGLASVPHVSGLNNHMGSALTRNSEAMEWVMEWVKTNGGLYFVDSLTTSHSVALDSAREAGLPAIGRDVFLDADADTQVIHRQFLRLIEIARDQGTGLGIGHPYPETLSVLRDVLLKPSYYGVELVSVQELITRRERDSGARARAPSPSVAGRPRFAANSPSGKLR